MPKRFLLPLTLGLFVGAWLPQATLFSPVHSQEAKPPESKLPAAEGSKKAPDAVVAKKATAVADDPDLKVVRASAEAFEKAYNAADAKSLAALFAENAEVVDEDDHLIAGRANIEARFAEIFKEFPKAKIEVTVGTVRKLSPDVAIEEGSSTVTLEPEAVPSRSPYAIVHLKRDGKWQFGSVRDFPEEETESSHDHLDDLEWLVGSWVDESRQGRVETVCRWSDDGHYLLQDYAIKTRQGDQLKGTQRIGWDPLRQTVRAWVFDDGGGFMESTWTNVDGVWITKVEGTTADGDAVSATRVLTPLENDTYLIESTSQIVGGELLPDSLIKVVRQPPLPKD